MSFDTGFDKDDLRFLAHIKILPPDETDIHAGCYARCLAERQGRELAERRVMALRGILNAESQRSSEAIHDLRHSLLRWRSFFLGQLIIVVSAFGFIEIGWPALVPPILAISWLPIWRLLCRLRLHSHL
jgi:hypothetical protein